jgi:hypothetical protein
MATTIPRHIQDNPQLRGQLIVALADALSTRMDESDWKRFSTLHGLDHLISDHPRFLRSLHWGDPDHPGLVLDLVKRLYKFDESAFIELFEQPQIRRWLKENNSDILDAWHNKTDPLVDAISHALDEVQQLKPTVDLRDYTRRIKAALPSDPSLAVGTTKDMLEATMRTILRERGLDKVDQLDFPALTTKCFMELGLSATVAPSSPEEKCARKIASSANKMIEAANELRNASGTGHGHVVGEESKLTVKDANLVASTGLILAAWMLRHSRDIE